MAVTTGPKAIGLRLEACLPLGFEGTHDLGLLRPIENDRNAEWALLPICLGDIHPLDSLGNRRRVTLAHPFGQSGLAGAVTMTTSSMPAVLRPAVRSVTRRTLTRALARDRSINFCKWRTFFRSRACDAVKMRWCRRRTWSSTSGQLTDPPVEHVVLGSVRHLVEPLWRLTWPSVRVPSSIVYLTGSPDPRQHPLGSGHLPVSGQLCGTAGEGATMVSRVSCCLSATGVGFSGHPFPAEVGLPCGRLAALDRTPSEIPRSTRARFDRGGCLLYPGDGGAHPADKKSPTGACRFSATSPYTPLQRPILWGSR
jgi:hypothetical protein